jgi:SAM-dependent methyltransferase
VTRGTLAQAFTKSARLYDSLSGQKDYAAASATLRKVLRKVAPNAKSLLDVACGTGRHLQHLRDHFSVAGLDRSPEMLEVARQRCVGVPLYEGSLVGFRLSRTFDVVTCLFGSIGYARTTRNLNRAVRTMKRHLRSGGALVVEPWVTPDRFVSGKLVFDRVDEPDLKIARMYVTSREGRLSVFESDYLVCTADGVRHFRERQELGLFTDEEYRAAFLEAGLEIVDMQGDLFGYGLYVCRVPSGDRANG